MAISFNKFKGILSPDVTVINEALSVCKPIFNVVDFNKSVQYPPVNKTLPTRNRGSFYVASNHPFNKKA